MIHMNDTKTKWLNNLFQRKLKWKKKQNDMNTQIKGFANIDYKENHADNVYLKHCVI